jgi:1,4-dihydroxy-2-naphthoate octaprenyltransferase
MNIFAIFLGAGIGLLGWSFLTHLSYAIHDAANKTTLANKLSDPNGAILTKLLWWVAVTALIWLMFFSAACWHFAHSNSSSSLVACFFGGFMTTSAIIAFTTTRGLRRLKQHSAKRAQL